MSTVPPPYDDLLSDPYSVYPPTDLTKALYPEVSAEGLGRRGLFPFATFMIELWNTWASGDYYGFRLFDLTKPVASGNAQTKEPRYPVNILGSQIPEGDNPYFARVLRVGSLQESRSATQTVFCKQTIPGGVDRRIWEPWHSGYLMWLRDLQEGAILNPDTIAGGLWVVIDPYLYIRQNDVIMIYVDGILFEYVVGPADAASKAPIEILIPEAILLQITPSGPVGIVFTVRDVVGNVPEGKYWLSKVIMLLSELKPGQLDSPIFTLDGNETTQVDLDVLGNSLCQVQVTPPRKTPTPNPRNQIVVIFEITLGKVTRTVRLPAVPDRNLKNEMVSVDNTLLKELAGGWFHISFEWLSPAGALLGRSNGSQVFVFGTPTLMPPLTLTPFQAGLIPPNTDVQATIPSYTPHDPQNLETVVLERIAPGGGGERVAFLQLAGPQGGTRQLPMARLAVFEGKGPAQAYYETNDGNGKPGSMRQSETLEFEIGVRDAVLPAIEIEHAKFENIDPGDVKGAETQMFVTYTGTVAGDKVHINVIGKDQQSSFTDIITVTTATEGVTFTMLGIPLSKTLLIDNADGSIRVSYTVETPGTPSVFLASEVRDYTVGVPIELKPLVIQEANAADGTIVPKAVLKGATLTIDYSPKRKGDVLRWKWSGQFNVSVIQGEVAVNSTTTSITVPIPSSVIATGLRPEGNNVTVSCELLRGQFSNVFKDLYVRLLPLELLPTPKIGGFANTTVLPVDQLKPSARITVGVWDFMDVDQLKWCTCTGTLADGTTYSKDILIAGKVTPSELVSGISLPAPVEDLRKLKEGSLLTIKFWVNFAKLPLLQTATLFGVANFIIQLLPAVLAYPTLNGAANTAQETTVDPLAIQNKTSVTIAYAGMLATDKITLMWIFWNGTQFSITVNGVAKGSVVVDLTAAQVLHNSINSTVQLKYSIVRNGKITPSNVQTVIVANIAQDKLPRPLINGLAAGAILALNSFTGDAKAAVGKWTFSKVGQLLWLSVIAGGRELKVLEAYKINASDVTNGVLDRAVSRDWIAEVGNGSHIEVKLWVSFSSDKNRAAATLFPTTVYTADTQLRPPVITLAIIASTGGSVPDGGTFSTALGAGVLFQGTCDARPFARTVRVGGGDGGGYITLVPANDTNWSLLTLYTSVNQWNGVAVYEVNDPTVHSNVFIWYRS